MMATLMKKKVFNHLVLLLIGIIMMVPFIWLLSSTLKTNVEINAVPPTFFPTLPTIENYLNVFKKFKIWIYFSNSIVISSVKTFIGVYTSTLIGFIFAKYKFKFKNAIFGIVLFSMMIPDMITIIPSYQIINAFGWIDKYIALVIPVFFSAFGIFMMKQYISNAIPDDYIEAARVDGASEIRIFHSIIIPMSVNMISALSIFLFLWNWEDFLWPYLVLNTSTKFPLAVALNMFSGQNNTDYGGLFAATSITILPVVTVYFFMQKRFIEGVSMSGVK